jgi:endonuclease/exonuclease/phosphatase family metal-dependent hydrolase
MRVMSWNISRFNTESLHRGPNNLNMWYIAGTITTAEPDILILIEVQSGKGPMGSLITAGGKTGVLELLAILRNFNVAGQIDWMLVPPLKLVDSVIDTKYTEGIGVFYNNATLDFQGPYYWDSEFAKGVSFQIDSPYTGAWAATLPGGNNRAGKYEFQSTSGQAIGFPNLGNRPPFYTLFRERGGANRNIHLFSVHLPPHRAPAAEAMYKLANVSELGNMGANDVFVAAGDFNYDPRPQISDTSGTAEYYDKAVNGAFGDHTYMLGQPLLAQGTRVHDTFGSTPDNYRLDERLDNIFARYGSMGIVPAAHNAAVIDAVAGVPAPYITDTDMEYSLAEILNSHGPTIAFDALLQIGLFQGHQNFGHIARWNGVSDHLPIIAVI